MTIPFLPALLRFTHLFVLITMITAWQVPAAKRPLSRTAIAVQQQQQQQSEESIRQDIEEMRQEAARRLKELQSKMERVKKEIDQHEKEKKREELLESAAAAMQVEIPEGRQSKHTQESKPTTQPSTKDSAPVKPPEKEIIVSSNRVPHVQEKVDRYDLLDNTRWKVVFNIGREPGTWMPPDWGASGERLLFQVVLDFTDQTLYSRDDFFQGVAGSKVLQVKDSWVFPTGVGAASTGRHPISVEPTGGYKVLQGQGPMGTDIVRFYIELKETVEKPGSDVTCPAGRIYGTCGYFPIHQTSTQWKDVLAEEHHAVLMKYEELQAVVDADDWLSVDKIKHMKELYDVKRQLEQVTKRLQQARQKEPDRSQLRLSRDGSVGLTREGGVCRKIVKGLTVEYHILGRMELACVDPRQEHDEYADLVHQLHP